MKDQTFTDHDAGRAGLQRSFFSHVLEFGQLDFTRNVSEADGLCNARLFGIGEASIGLLLVEARDFHCCSQVVSVLLHRVRADLPKNFPALVLDDLILQPTVLCDNRTMLLFSKFCDFCFASPRAGLCTEK